MHRSEDEQDNSQLPAERFEDSRDLLHFAIKSQEEAHKANVHKVESHHQKMVHTIRHLSISLEAIHKEHPSVLMQSSSDPDRDRDGNGKIEAVSYRSFIHGFILFLVGDSH